MKFGTNVHLDPRMSSVELGGQNQGHCDLTKHFFGQNWCRAHVEVVYNTHNNIKCTYKDNTLHVAHTM